MKIRLQVLNRWMLGMIVGVNSVTLLLIFHPTLTYWWHTHLGNKPAEFDGLIENNLAGRKTSSTEPRLIIPKMLLDEELYLGDSPDILKKGAWLRPHTSTPEMGANTVIVGHRTAFSRSPVFYHLDKLRRGDRLAVFWEGIQYVYEVNEIQEVAPSAREIEQPSAEPQLTLYTCTPLGTTFRRLVVIARQVSL